MLILSYFSAKNEYILFLLCNLFKYKAINISQHVQDWVAVAIFGAKLIRTTCICYKMWKIIINMYYYKYILLVNKKKIHRHQLKYVFLLCSVNESYYTEFWMINQPCNPEWNQNWTYVLSFSYITACFCKYYLLKVSFMFLSWIGQYFFFLFSFCFKTKLLCFCKLKWWIILHFPFSGEISLRLVLL